MGETVMRNGVEIDLEVVKRIRERILREEDWNHRTHEKSSSAMIELVKKIMEEEMNAY